MSDGLPTDDQLRRIERGVQRRIDLRRRAARRAAGVAGAALAVALLGGGLVLVRPVLVGTSSGSAASSGKGAPASDRVAVVCHGTPTRSVEVERSGLPAAALHACAAAGPGAGGASRAAGAGASPAPSPASVLCRAADGRLHVYPGAAACSGHGMTPFPG